MYIYKVGRKNSYMRSLTFIVVFYIYIRDHFSHPPAIVALVKGFPAANVLLINRNNCTKENFNLIQIPRECISKND